MYHWISSQPFELSLIRYRLAAFPALMRQHSRTSQLATTPNRSFTASMNALNLRSFATSYPVHARPVRLSWMPVPAPVSFRRKLKPDWSRLRQLNFLGRDGGRPLIHRKRPAVVRPAAGPGLLPGVARRLRVSPAGAAQGSLFSPYAAVLRSLSKSYGRIGTCSGTSNGFGISRKTKKENLP